MLVKRMFSQAPGVYMLLRGLARRKAGMDPVDLFLRNPANLYELLVGHYGDDFTATFVFRNLFVKPLADYLGLYDRVDELTKAAMRGCEELLKVIASSNPAVSADEVGLCVVREGGPLSAGGGDEGRHAIYLIHI